MKYRLKGDLLEKKGPLLRSIRSDGEILAYAYVPVRVQKGEK